jgi:hypothetical protein
MPVIGSLPPQRPPPWRPRIDTHMMFRTEVRPGRERPEFTAGPHVMNIHVAGKRRLILDTLLPTGVDTGPS